MTYTTHYRLQYIDQSIRQNKYPSVPDLAAELECSERTIHRDIAYLRDMLGAPVDCDRKMNGYYYKDETWILPAIVFSQQELIALMVAKNAAINYTGMPYKTHLISAFDKIFEFVPKESKTGLDGLNADFTFRFSGAREINPEIMNLVSTALKEKHSIEMQYYTASRDEVTRRVIDPYHLDNYQGDWYLVGYCHLRSEIRTFAVNRIEKCLKLNSNFEKPEDFDYKTLIKNSLGVIHSDKLINITIRFTGIEARLNRERNLHPSKQIEEQEDGSILMKLKVSGIEEIKRWILSSGSCAEVLEPSWLAEEIAAEAEAIRKNYEKPLNKLRD